MVMRNRHDGSNTPQWWEDLPPRVRDRFSQQPVCEEEPTRPTPEPTITRREIVSDMSRFMLLFGFAMLAVAYLLFLLVALSFVTGR